MINKYVAMGLGALIALAPVAAQAEWYLADPTASGACVPVETMHFPDGVTLGSRHDL